MFDWYKYFLYRLNQTEGVWEPKTLPEEAESLILSGTDPDTLYVAAGFSGVFKSINGGLTWEAQNRGLEGVSASELQTAQEKLFVKTDVGFFAYRDY